jgi:hypothetical protein
MAYWSASLVKTFLECPARAMAELRGEYVRPESTALLVGSYVDAYFEGTLELFKAKHPELFKKDGGLKAEYIKAEEMIARAERDELFMRYMEGEKQVIKTGTIFGLPFKAKYDVHLVHVRNVDVKTAKNMEPMYKPEQGRITFAEYWNWPLQMAIYQAIDDEHLPQYLNVITKEDPPDIATIEIPQHHLDAELEVLSEKMPYFDAIKQGIVEPTRCEKCPYCRASKKQIAPISLDDLIEL